MRLTRYRTIDSPIGLLTLAGQEGYRQFAGIPTNVSERVYALAREARRVGPGVRRPPPDCLSLVS